MLAYESRPLEEQEELLAAELCLQLPGSLQIYENSHLSYKSQ